MNAPGKDINHSADRGKEQFDAKGVRAVVGSAVHALVHNPLGLRPLLSFSRVCSGSALRAGAEVYKDWFFAGDNPVFPEGSFDRGDVSMFAAGPALRAIAERDNLFDPIPEIQSAMVKLVRASVSSVDVDPSTRARLRAAILQAKDEGRKLVVLGNHASHFDAAAYEAALHDATFGQYGLDGPRHVRLLAGAYMFYNKSVRVFTPAHRTLFVFGPKDFEEVKMRLAGCEEFPVEEAPRDPQLGRRTTTDGGASGARSAAKTEWRNVRDKDRDATRAFIGLCRKVVAGYAVNRDEIMVVFPYAGRGTDAHKFLGLKSKLPPGVLEQLSNPKALYLPAALAGTPAILDAHESKLWGKYNGFGRAPISLEIGQPIRGEDMDLGALHAQMCRIAYSNLDAFHARHGGVMPEKVPADVLKAIGA